MNTLHKDPAKVARAIMPAKHTGGVYDGIGCYQWYKRGGHAGSTQIVRSIEKATSLGFVRGKYSPTGTPDGSFVGHQEAYSHPDGWELTYSTNYGCVAYDNSFSMSLRQIKKDAL